MVIAPAVPGHRHAVRHHLPRACPELRRAGPLGVEPGILGVLQLADERAIDGGRAEHARSVRGWPGAGSNCRHRGFQPRALPTELPGRAPVAAGQRSPTELITGAFEWSEAKPSGLANPYPARNGTSAPPRVPRARGPPPRPVR